VRAPCRWVVSSALDTLDGIKPLGKRIVNIIIYIVGLVVVIGIVLSFFGLR